MVDLTALSYTESPDFSVIPSVRNIEYTWVCRIGGRNGFSFYFEEDKVPNRFHRAMMRLWLGWEWEKLNLPIKSQVWS